MTAYWQKRARTYNSLEWVRDRKFLGEIVSAGNFRKSDVVLEVGTGTGIVAEAIAPLVDTVTAIDTSSHMLDLARSNHSNIMRKIGDARKLEMADGSFDAVVARYVFHHILVGAEKAMAECYRVLRHGGIMVFSEGVPPSHRTKQDYIDIFRLKEKRVTFMPDDMARLMLSAGFGIASRKCIWLRQMSMRNWVEGGGVSKANQEAIMQMRRNAPDYVKRDYNMTETKDDCLIDMKVAILVGTKY